MSGPAATGDDALWRRFVDPPDEARPRVWWHWMDGNIDPAGVRRDLEWLHSVGVRGVQLFDGGLGVPCVVGEPVRPGSAIWDDVVVTARTVAAELGLELAVATSPGWSAAGGPWVRPEDAMKKVVWSLARVSGGSAVDVELPPLPDATGLYQDSPRWGAAAPDGDRCAVEWAVLAFPADSAHEVLRPQRVTASGEMGDWSALVDASFDDAVTLPRDPDGTSTAWVEQIFDEPVSVTSVVVGLPGPRGFGAAPAASAVLQSSDDGVSYRDVVDLPATTSPARTASFTPVTARHFRLVLAGDSAAAALPPVADGVRLPPVLRRASSFAVSEFALRSGGRVHAAEAKAGFTVVPDYYAVDTDERVDVGAVDPDAIVDVTAHVTDGVLRWEAPPGNWTILRLGASLTGQTNGPAPADSTGPEVDKLDGRRVAAYLDTYLERFGADAFEGDGMPSIAALLSDSIEAGPQNFTDDIAEHFARLRGYNPRPWLPALAGFVVGDAAASDRFLYDYRRTITELIAEQYYGTLAAVAHERGMIYYAEALEDGRPQLGDDLAMRSHADVPMGAMWTFDAAAAPRPTYVADLKGASSVTHVYGKTWTGSEAFTSFGDPWSWSPQNLKHVADLQLALGVTRFCIHTSPHQPLAAPAPGIALAPFLGQAFTVHETWADMARPWIDYLARCSALLSLGVPAVDIAVFVGEEAPVTGLFDGALDASVQQGFDYDYIGADALADVLAVDDAGDIVSAGATYRLLHLGGSSRRMTVKALAHIERLLHAGATVVGRRPHSSPSLADDPDAFDELCDRIWGERSGPGRVLDTTDLAAALIELSLRPPLEVVGAPVRQIARLVDGQRLTFLANPSAEPVSVRVLVDAASAPLEVWDPVAVAATTLAFTPGEDGRVTCDLALPPFGSVFLMPATGAATAVTYGSYIVLDDAWSLQLPQHPPITMPDGPVLWTDASVGATGFSGMGTYRTEVILDVRPARAVLELAQVRDIARVTVNGIECGVAWTPPFRVDVSAAVRVGINTVEIEVANPWRNRLIAEAAEPSGEIFAPMTAVFEPDAAPLPAGLAGPVRLRVSDLPGLTAS